MIILAQLSDTHVLAHGEEFPCGVDHNRQLDAAVEAINAEPRQPVGVLATGDLTNSGLKTQMSELTTRLDQLSAPVLAIPGNHDNQADFRSTFNMPWDSAEHLSWSVEIDELRILGLDVTVPGEDYAIFDEAREQWLRDRLQEDPARPTAIAMHQPPFLTGIEWMDSTAISNRDRFIATLSDFSCVSRIFCGHLHRPVQTTVGHVTASVGISTIYHVALDLTEGSSVQLIRDPAGYQLHCWLEGQWVSHTRYIGRSESAFTPKRR